MRVGSNKPSKPPARSTPRDGYGRILTDLVELLEAARRTSVRAVNAVITATYWQIGRRIVEAEQSGQHRAEYGKLLVHRLAHDLTERFGRGFGKSNLYQMRNFYLAYQQILQAPSGELHVSGSAKILQQASGKSDVLARRPAAPFPLPWSHYVRLLSVKDELGRRFYETEAMRGGWSLKQLARQINTQFYERTALSRDKPKMLTKHAEARPEDHVAVEEQIKDPFVLEFLGLRDEYSESDLEEALIRHLETFLLELGGDFTFVGRQRRRRVGDTWYRIDLLFFHRKLRCLVIIDLKLGRFTHSDAGQMHLYCNYAREHWTHDDENPPVGLILFAQADSAVAKYALEGLPSKVLAAEYRTVLPTESMLAAEIDRTRRRLEARLAAARSPGQS